MNISSAGGIHRKNRKERAYEQDPQAVKAWLETTYPAIEQRARQEDAEIAWGDESGLRSDAHVGRGYALIGHTPEIQPSTQRVSVNYIASISNWGKVRFMLYTQKLTAQVLLLFLNRLIAKRTRKLLWIVDRQESASLPSSTTVVTSASRQHRDVLLAVLLAAVESSRISQL